MHPFPTPMLMGQGGTLIGYFNIPSPGSSWSVPFPSGTRAGDMIVIVVSDSNDLTGLLTFSNSGGSATYNYSAQGGQTNLSVYHKVLDATDISSGVTVTSAISTICGSVFVFRGITSPFNGTQSNNNAALSNGSTVTATGFSASAQTLAAIFIVMTKSATFTTDTQVGTYTGRVNGANSSFVWQVFAAGYGNQNVSWSNVQNMGFWCATSEDLRS